MKLLLPILCNLCLVLLCDQLGRRMRFRQLSDRTKQWVIGVLFGCMAAFASEYGVPVGGVIMNVRDAAPICAGLIFGAPAGIIAGLIGGLYRWVSVAWGGRCLHKSSLFHCNHIGRLHCSRTADLYV